MLFAFASTDALQALVGRVQSLQEEVDKLTSGNEMLQMYIENLSKQIKG